jgi:outer membrane protein OmpA-like peptidoglycan-associated protein
MKAFIIAALFVPVVALADRAPPPRGPDFVVVKPARNVDRTVVASEGIQPIEPLELVLFSLDSAALDPIALDQLDVLARWMKRYPEQNLVLEGHTDILGSDEYNTDLGKRRAMAVRDHLRSWGISGDRIVVAVFGERGAHACENAGDRKVVVFASDRPVRELAEVMLDHSRADSVAWMERGARLEETRGITAQR